MIICGIKLTHDGGVAIIDDDKLVCSIEIEKLANNSRYSVLPDLEIVKDILADAGYPVTAVDRFVLDGWHGADLQWKGPSLVRTRNNGQPVTLEVAPYNETRLSDDILHTYSFRQMLPIGDNVSNYNSYLHVTGHVVGAYSTSSFAAKHESAFVLCWDGGLYPRLYYYDVALDRFLNLGHLFMFLGTIYSIFSQYFGPYKKTVAQLEEDAINREIEHYFGGYSAAGKIMSYIALGRPSANLVSLLRKTHREMLTIDNTFEHIFSRGVRDELAGSSYTDADILLGLHNYLGELLIETLGQQLAKYPGFTRNICLTGGCALNIKWNSQIRNSGLFQSVWVPPFPNDAGSALGTAAAEMYASTNRRSLQWSVFSGPMIGERPALPGWKVQPCTIGELAYVLHTTGEPVLFLHGKAELGPRALGHRSILAPAVNGHMKTLLNEVKKREDFRPVAPICLEHRAPDIFDPGTPDPYMLFDHQVRDNWKSVVPAICHLDGSARLQTVNTTMSPVIFELLKSYEELSGIPLLCNTSANHNGSGFFPDTGSAASWGRLNYMWCNNILYIKEEKAVWKTVMTTTESHPLIIQDHITIQ